MINLTLEDRECPKLSGIGLRIKFFKNGFIKQILMGANTPWEFLLYKYQFTINIRDR